MSAKQSRGGEHLRQVAVAIAGEDHAVRRAPARPPAARGGRAARPCPPAAAAPPACAARSRPKARQEQLVAPVGGQARHGHDHRGAAQLELVADRLGRRRDRRSAAGRPRPGSTPRARPAGRPRGSAPRSVATPRRRRPCADAGAAAADAALHRAHVVEGPHAAGTRVPSAPRGRTEQRQPVVVRVMGVDDVDALLPRRARAAARRRGPARWARPATRR